MAEIDIMQLLGQEEVDSSANGYFQSVPMEQQFSEETPEERTLANALLALSEKESNDRQRTAIERASLVNTEANKGTYGNAKIKASVQPNGTVLIEGRGPTTDEILGTTAGLKNNKPFSIATLDEEIKSIANEKDPVTRNLMLGNLKASAGEFQIGLVDNIRTTTYQAAEIPQLEAQLQAQRNSDKLMAVGNGLPPIDSPLTQALLKTIEQRKVEAEESIKRAMSTNLTYNALTAKLSTIEPLMKRQETLDLNKQSMLDQKEILGETQRAAEAAQLPPYAGARAIELGLATDNTNLYDKLTGKGISDEDKEALIARPEELPALAIAKRNTAARKLLMKDPAVAEETAQVEKLYNTPSVLVKEASKYLDISKEELDSIYKLASPVQIDNSKEAIAQRDNARLNLATRIVSASKFSSFVDKADNWVTDNPEFKDAAQKVKEAGLKPSMENVFKIYLGEITDPLQRKAKLTEFTKIAMANASTTNTIYGGVDMNVLAQRMPLMLIRSSRPEYAIKDTLGMAASGLGNFFSGKGFQTAPEALSARATQEQSDADNIQNELRNRN
jgi:hypothetical protein